MKKLFIYLFILIVTFSCATITSPTGGPRDEQAPQLLYSNPPDQSLNFKENQITLEFDEYLQLVNPKEEILITPRLKEEYEIFLKKKSVILKFNEELQEETTYNINFRNAVGDLNEKNPAENLTIAFSTGSVIDTAWISGNIFDLETQKPLPDISVGLYQYNDTLNIFNSPPDYLSVSDKEGNWKISNLAKGNYKIYALKDENRNSILDIESELYGFIADTLKLDSSINNLKIPVLKHNLLPIEKISNRTSGKYYTVKYNKSIADIEIQSQDSLHYIIEELKTIKFYNTIDTDSTQTILHVSDSTGQYSIDTVYVKFTESPRKYDEYKITILSNSFNDQKFELNTQILFSKPSKLFNQDSLTIFMDSLNHIKTDSSSFIWNKNNTELTIKSLIRHLIHDSLQITNSKIILAENSFISIEEDSSSSLTSKIDYIKSDNTGAIEVEVLTDYPSYIIQILDQKYQVISEIRNKAKFSFTYLPPKNYIIRVLIDNNNNGSWDKGNIYNNKEPESVYIYHTSEGSEEIILRKNFVIGPNLLEF